MSDVLHRHSIFKSFGNVYSVSVISVMLLKMYVQHFLVADSLTCVVPGICAAPGDLDLDPFNVFERIFREWHPSGDRPIGLRDEG
jgi:hypothetical protein